MLDMEQVEAFVLEVEKAGQWENFGARPFISRAAANKHMTEVVPQVCKDFGWAPSLFRMRKMSDREIREDFIKQLPDFLLKGLAQSVSLANLQVLAQQGGAEPDAWEKASEAPSEAQKEHGGPVPDWQVYRNRSDDLLAGALEVLKGGQDEVYTKDDLIRRIDQLLRWETSLPSRVEELEEALRYCRSEAQAHKKSPAAWAPAVIDRVNAALKEGAYRFTKEPSQEPRLRCMRCGFFEEELAPNSPCEDRNAVAHNLVLVASDGLPPPNHGSGSGKA